MGYLEVHKRNGTVDIYPGESYLTLMQMEEATGVTRPTIKKHAKEKGLLIRDDDSLKPTPYHIMLSDFLRLIDKLANTKDRLTGIPYWPWLSVEPNVNSEGLASLVIIPPENRVVFTRQAIYYFRPA